MKKRDYLIYEVSRIVFIALSVIFLLGVMYLLLSRIIEWYEKLSIISLGFFLFLMLNWMSRFREIHMGEAD